MQEKEAQTSSILKLKEGRSNTCKCEYVHQQEQIYHVELQRKVQNKSPRRDLNSRPLVYKTSALTPELRRRRRTIQRLIEAIVHPYKGKVRSVLISLLFSTCSDFIVCLSLSENASGLGIRDERDWLLTQINDKLWPAVTRIRTWVIAATTQCTNHYTITAIKRSKIQFGLAPKYTNYPQRQYKIVSTSVMLQ